MRAGQQAREVRRRTREAIKLGGDEHVVRSESTEDARQPRPVEVLRADELRRVLPADGTVYLLGGDAAVSPAVADAVTRLGLRPVRLSGPSRIETALVIADEVRRRYGAGSAVLVARAYPAAGNPTSGWADSVTGGAYGALTRTPIIITPTDSLHPKAADWLGRSNTTRSIILGGDAAIGEAVARQLTGATRVSGPERTATAARIATNLIGARPNGARQVVLINGHDRASWTHGLAGGGLAADRRAPVLMLTPVPPGVPAPPPRWSVRTAPLRSMLS